MGNPPDDKTTINVKSVSVSSWERAKSCAARHDEAMGTWLSRAINQLADADAGPREFPPVKPEAKKISEDGNPGSPGGLAAGDLAGLMQGIAALASASGTPPAKADVRRAYGLADAMVRDAAGIPRRPRAIRAAPALLLIEAPAETQPAPVPGPAKAEPEDAAPSPAEAAEAPTPAPAKPRRPAPAKRPPG